MWHYILSVIDAQHEFRHLKKNICFIGHSHFPIVFSEQGYTRDAKVELLPDIKYIINVGSVGQPRDGDSRACAVVFDTEKLVVETYRIPYDIERSQGRILDAGLPDSLAIRLAFGQ